MNKLYVLHSMRLKITWKTIYLGLYGWEDGQPILTQAELEEFICKLLAEPNSQIDPSVKLLLSFDDLEEEKRILEKLSQEENSLASIQIRKWKALLLKMILQNRNPDALQGVMELMDFWIHTAKTESCPMKMPETAQKDELDSFFSEENYDFIISQNAEWLENEIKNIRLEEESVKDITEKH